METDGEHGPLRGEKVNVKANGGILLVAHAKPFVGGGARVSQCQACGTNRWCNVGIWAVGLVWACFGWCWTRLVSGCCDNVCEV